MLHAPRLTLPRRLLRHLILHLPEDAYGAPSHRGEEGRGQGAPAEDEMWAGQPWEGIDYTSDHNLRHGW